MLPRTIFTSLPRYSFLALALASVACDYAPDDIDLADATETGDPADFAEPDPGDGDEALLLGRVILPPPSPIPIGAQWGPCDLTGVDQPGWWGCNGSLGVGLACARPVSDGLDLNICVPQTADPAVPDNCSGLVAPFGDGVRLQGSAYCVVDCTTDADCAGGMACSPSSHLCAWIGS
jgi:hypothetical protein